MDRRDFLSRCAFVAGGVATLGGCTERTLKEAEAPPPSLEGVFREEEVELPIRQKFEIAEEGTLQAEGVTLADPKKLRAYLDDQEILVESLETVSANEKRFLELAYSVPRFVERGILYGLGLISGGYAALVDGGFDADELHASIRAADGRAFGEFRVATRWAVEYLDGELTAAEYAGTVADTAETSV